MAVPGAQLYEHSFLKVNCTANGVIPVLDTGMALLHRSSDSR
ncbi:hypothetical protein [Wolbachia pipientis]|nr:hypothetical protein [Wolbachia pipientis]